MAITINVYGSVSDQPTGRAAEAISVDAGASAALAPIGSAAEAMHAELRDQAVNAGPPSPMLVQEIEAALSAAGIVGDGSASTDGMNAGAAPV